MNSRLLFSSVALAALACLTACGGGGASEDSAATQAQASSVGGIGGSGVAGIGGIGGTGSSTQGIGGIGGTGSDTQGIGGIGGTGSSTQGIGGIGGSGVNAQSVGGIGGSGVNAQSVGGIGGSGIQSVAHAQACGLRSVSVTVAGARVNANGAADLGSEGWVDVALAAPVQVDLLQLAAGGALPLNLSSLPDGSYRQIRLLVVADDAANPLADTIVTLAGVQTPLAVPSTSQGGLPMAVSITVAGGQVSASYRDLDVCSAVTTTAGAYALGAVTSGTTQVASAY
jgi:hypothetical protein